MSLEGDAYEALGIETMDDAHFRRFLVDRFIHVDKRLDQMDAGFKRRQDETNGRVSKLEKFMWSLLGGLAVVTAIVVPLFLDVVG